MGSHSILVFWQLRYTWPQTDLHLISCIPIHPLQTSLSWQLEFSLNMGIPVSVRQLRFYFIFSVLNELGK